MCFRKRVGLGRLRRAQIRSIERFASLNQVHGLAGRAACLATFELVGNTQSTFASSANGINWHDHESWGLGDRLIVFIGM